MIIYHGDCAAGPGVQGWLVEFETKETASQGFAMKTALLGCTLLFFFTTARAIVRDDAPATAFDLQQWKLQIPGPKEIKTLGNYSSAYFRLNAAKEMCFHLDAAEKGTTPNSHYVRSELRHLPEWGVKDAHTLSAEVCVLSHLKPDKVTVLQIHGVTKQGGNAPPLLRIAVNNGDLIAVIKTTNDGDKNDTVLLKKGLGSGWAKVEVSVKSKQLKITVDDQEKVSRSLAFWKYPNYFKAGCYPQATNGTVEVRFRKLIAN
jgi:hypothetical protein